MHDAIFLTTPSSLFTDVTEAHHCARALRDYIDHFCEKNDIDDTEMYIGVSNVNPRRAHYVNVKSGVGRPRKTLVGNLTNCYVRPHLHIVVLGKYAGRLSNVIIKYFIRKYDSIKKRKQGKKGVRIWKKYIIHDTEGNVIKYIWIQSIHFLTYKSKKSKTNDTKSKNRIKKRIRIFNIKTKKQINAPQNTASQGNYSQNYVLLCNLRNQWLLTQQLKKVSYHIVNYELHDKLIALQSKIKMYGEMINLKVDVIRYYNDEIARIAIELENLRQYTNNEKQKYDYSVTQPIYS